MTKKWVDHEFHPLANAWPLMEGEELQNLADSIKIIGQQLPILRYENKIIDGRNRYNACKLINHEPWYEDIDDEVDGTDKELKQRLWAMNDQRRHMPMEERAILAATFMPAIGKVKTGRKLIGDKPMTNTERSQRMRCNETLPGERVSLQKPKRPKNGVSIETDKMSKRFNVSPSAIQRARVVLSKGTPATIKAVREGKLKLTTTAEKLKPSTPRKKDDNDKPKREHKTSMNKGLRSEQVDAELFERNPAAFVEKYGHGPYHKTKEQYEKQWSNDAVTDYITLMQDITKQVTRTNKKREADHDSRRTITLTPTEEDVKRWLSEGQSRRLILAKQLLKILKPLQEFIVTLADVMEELPTPNGIERVRMLRNTLTIR